MISIASLFSLAFNIQYFSGFATFFTRHQYHFKLTRFSISSLSNILSQFIINISQEIFISFIAAPVHFSSHCSI